MAIVEAPLALFEMQIKGMSSATIELLQTPLSKAPKAFDTVDMTAAKGELISRVVNLKMFSVTDIHQAIIAPPAVTVDRHFGCHTASNNGLQRGFLTVWHLISTIKFERDMREGIDDYCYLLTLSRLMQQKPNHPAAAAGRKLLADKMASFQLGERSPKGTIADFKIFRLQVAQAIERLAG